MVAKVVREFLILVQSVRILVQCFPADNHLWSHKRSVAQNTGEDAYFIHVPAIDSEGTTDNQVCSFQIVDAEHRLVDNADFVPDYFSD